MQPYIEQQFIRADDQLYKGNIHNCFEVLDNLVSNEFKIDKTELRRIQLICAERYINSSDLFLSSFAYDNEVLDSISSKVNKALGLYNQNISILINETANPWVFDLNRARAKMVLSDVERLKSQKPSKKSIDLLSESISYYWEGLKFCPDVDEVYHIKNNLANSLARMGRFCEALSILNENIGTGLEKFQSYASWSDQMEIFARASILTPNLSMSLVMIERFKQAIQYCDDSATKTKLDIQIKQLVDEIKANDIDYSCETIIENRWDEEKYFSQQSDYRKFVLENQLALNEHSTYCFCNHSAKDDLQIGANIGTQHIHLKLTELDIMVNRMVSEFAYARFLLYGYVEQSHDFPEDLVFTNFIDYNVLGYRVEGLKTCYRLSYSLLDKIKNGLVVLLNLEMTDSERKKTYFEDLFDRRKDIDITRNYHLMALYSISRDLSRNTGKLAFHKEYRNLMEHDTLIILSDNGENTSDLPHVRIKELEANAFELLRTIRSAIFSFVHLIRVETIH